MRLFHVSQQADIPVFEPRVPTRADMDGAVPLVWAIDESRLINYLTPRNCPRVCMHKTPRTTAEDARALLPGPAGGCVAIEHGWHRAMESTTLYLYELDPAGFCLQDTVAGYWTSRHPQRPVDVTAVASPLAALFQRGAEVRLVGNLWPLADAVQASSLDWSLCRMAFALPRGQA